MTHNVILVFHRYQLLILGGQDDRNIQQELQENNNHLSTNIKQYKIELSLILLTTLITT